MPERHTPSSKPAHCIQLVACIVTLIASPAQRSILPAHCIQRVACIVTLIASIVQYSILLNLKPLSQAALIVLPTQFRLGLAFLK